MQRWKKLAMDALSLPRDALVKEMRVLAEGNRVVSIAGVESIKKYLPDHLRMQVVGGTVEIEGFELILHSIGAGVVVVCGRIDRLSFDIHTP